MTMHSFENANIPPIIAVVDDDLSTAEDTLEKVRDMGLEGKIIQSGDGGYETVSDLLDILPLENTGFLCDHRLQPRGFANFFGSELVSALYRKGIPSILMTLYSDQDSEVSIRKDRQFIPVMLTRNEMSIEAIRSGFQACQRELSGEIPSSRKPYRSLVRITNLTQSDGEDVADAIIPGWNPHIAVRFPLSLIQEHSVLEKLRSAIEIQKLPDARVFAKVNLGARQPEDLFFEQFEWVEPANS